MLEERKAVTKETVFLVGVYDAHDALSPDLKLDELASLVEAAGGVVVGRTVQRRPRGVEEGRPIHPATYVGRGKATALAELVESHRAQLVVFDNELSPGQIRELEEITKVRVIDRSELILDIFASRARTREAILQVELAQLEYTAPRLRGMWTHLERQAGTSGPGGGAGGTGGVGTRGPGEKQIEIDRRIVKQRIARLRRELAVIQERRRREVRTRGDGAFLVGLVGYTNAGKSTLMNAVTGAGTYAADQLFATLDTKTRRWQIEPGVTALLSDTVGFVRDLPHHLVSSFRSTLEEALNADLLLHVVDASHPQAREQMKTVHQVLGELGCPVDDVVCVLNKVDCVADPHELALLQMDLPDAVAISAHTGQGLEHLRHIIASRRRTGWAQVRVRASSAAGKLQSFVRAHAHIKEERYEDADWIAEVDLARPLLARLRALDAAALIETL